MIPKDVTSKIEALLDLPKSITLGDFEKYIAVYLERKADRGKAVAELDETIGVLQNHVFALSLYLKQHYLLVQQSGFCQDENFFYTKQELAVKYRVSVRTVTSWIADGLQTMEVGGVKRISQQALSEYAKQSKTKKFHWKSIAR
ncbi:MAG: helix-turn-helix domain-containing protein [Cytophagales bacterium]|jgi:hypothetical protein|nr:helix-turn-helix domain-containing protein [Cytophagales bacterium]